MDARSIFGNPIYSLMFGGYDEANSKFDGSLDEVITAMQENFQLARTVKDAA